MYFDYQERKVRKDERKLCQAIIMPYIFGVYLKPFAVQMMSIFNDIFVINTTFFSTFLFGSKWKGVVVIF